MNTSDAILTELGHKASRWFQDHRHPRTGLVLDRARNFERPANVFPMCSLASVGYFLSLLPEWCRRGELSESAAAGQALQLLRFVRDGLDHQEGLLYHFVHWETGKRWERCEVSALDSAIFFNGCLVAAEAFKGDVATVADGLVDRANWPAFVKPHPRTGKDLLSLGWTPEQGLLGPADVRSSEMAMPYFLAVGSRTHGIDPQCWYNTSIERGLLCDREILNPRHPLFTSNYGLGWHDVQDMEDRDGVDLAANARDAALANRLFCQQAAGQCATYRDSEGGWWGISAGDSPRGYVADAPVFGQFDGTVWPCAALAALPWLRDVLADDLPRWAASHAWTAANGTYGLSPFNLDRRWVGEDVIGIDLGSFAVSLANHRERTVWDLWQAHPIASTARARLGYRKRGVGGSRET